MALAVETEDLGIAAGPQDRLVQAHEGLLYMDFADDGWRCEPLDPELLPPLFCAYREDAAAPSGGVHDDLRRRFEAGEAGTRSLLARIGELAERGREALLDGRAEALAGLMSRNFELRSQLVELAPAHVRMIELANELGGAHPRRLRWSDRRRRAGCGRDRAPPRRVRRRGLRLVAAIPPRFSAGRRAQSRFRGDARRGQLEMPGDRSGGAGVQLPSLPRVDAQGVLTDLFAGEIKVTRQRPRPSRERGRPPQGGLSDGPRRARFAE